MAKLTRKVNFGSAVLFCFMGFFICLLLIIWMAVYSYKTIQNESVSQSVAAIHSSLKTEQQKIGAITASYGTWSLTYDNTVAHLDQIWIDKNILEDLRKNFQISDIAIFNDDKEFSTLYSSNNTIGIVEKSAPLPLVDILLSYKNYIGNEKFVTGFAKIDHKVYFVAVSKMKSAISKSPFFMSIKPMTEDYLTDLSNIYALPDITLINQPEGLDVSSTPHISIKNNDKVIAYITWVPFQMASDIFNSLIPLGGLVILLLCAICFLVARKIYQTSYGYNRAMDDLSDVSEELALAQKNVNVAKQAKTKFLSMMSHEIKTPMNGLVGMINLLKDTELSEQQISYVNTMEASAESLLKLVDNILDFSKLESDEVSLVYGEVNVRQIISEIHGLLLPVALQKKLKFEMAFSEDVPLTVNTDGIRLRQIILHLVTNALKFTKVGAVKINVTAVNLPENRIELGIQVIDTGIGIAEGIKETLFNDFIRVGHTPPQAQSGAGLGLGIVKNLINLLQGKIGIESKLGQGSVFWIQLDVEVVKSFDKKEMKTSALKRGDSLKSILIINEEKGSVTHRFLEKNDSIISNARNEGEALTLLAQRKFDAIIMNLTENQRDLKVAPFRSAMKNMGKDKNIIPIFAIIDQEQQEQDLTQYDGVIHAPVTSAKLKDVLKMME